MKKEWVRTMGRASSQRTRATRRARGHGTPHVGSLPRGLLPRLRLAALTIAAFVTVGAFAVVVAMATTAPAQGSSSTTNGDQPSPDWVSLASTSPADIQSAARSTSMFQQMYNTQGTLAGQALHAGTLGTPVLVHAYRPTPGMPDVWVIPVLTPGATSASAGHVTMLLDFAYDPGHQRMRPLSFAGPFVASDPEYGQAFPRMNSQQALARFAAERPGGANSLSAAALASAQTQLVYFPVNLDQLNDPQHPGSWTAGGQFPDVAVWRVSMPGAADTIIGLDGHSYAATQLPLVANAAPAGD